MKRQLCIVCLLLLGLAVYGVETTTHDFTSNDVNEKPASFPTPYTVAEMTDHTRYTCVGEGATFTNNPSVGGVCVQLPKGTELIVSPAKEYLQEFYVYYSGAVTLTISLSTDGSEWTPADEIGSIESPSSTKRVYDLSGDYYIKIKNTTSTNTNAYIVKLEYYTNPVSCPNCFRYIPQ